VSKGVLDEEEIKNVLFSIGVEPIGGEH